MKRTLSALLPLLLIPLRVAAAQPQPTPAAAQAPAELPAVLRAKRPTGGEWYGLYILGKKAGFAFSELRAGEWNGQKVIIERSDVTLRAAIEGKPMERSIREERYYEPKDGGRLLGFRVVKSGDGGEETLIGAVRPDGISLTRVRPGIPDEKRELPATREVVEDSDAPRMVTLSRKTREGALLDLEDTLKDKKTTTTLEGEGTYLVAGVTVPVLRTRTLEEPEQLAVITTLAADGRALEIKYGDVMTAKAEGELDAKQLDKVDLFSLTRVVLPSKVPSSVRNPPAKLTWSIGGLPKAFWVETARQHYEAASDGTVRLTIKSRLPSAKAKRPVTAGNDPDLAKALEPTLAVESDAPAIRETAQRVVGGEADAWKAAKKLNLFVNGYLEKVYGASSDRATDVLKARKGDCTEHSLLLTALARAVGIPARRVDGLVYMESTDKVPALYWHEWVEVFVGEWIAIDPTFGQTVADPTHIAFGNEGRTDTAGLIGQLKIGLIKR
jgi:transglutaminase-like putative cysteine protease